MWPDPCPDSTTVSVRVIVVKVAVADFEAVTLNEQVEIPPEQSPFVHPVNAELGPGDAVNVTLVPWANCWVQVAGHAMPVGVLVTEPPPVPFVVTATGYVICPNVAVTDCALFIGTTHVPVPLHPDPLHPVNVEPALTDAVSVTDVPFA